MTIYRMVRDGQLDAVRAGAKGPLRIPMDSLRLYVRRKPRSE